MGMFFNVLFGIAFLGFGVLWLVISISDSFDSLKSKFASILTGFFMIGIGVFLIWPLVLLVGDWVTGSENLAGLIEDRQALQQERITSEVRWFGYMSVLVSLISVVGATLLVGPLLRDRAGAIEPWLLFSTTLSICGAVLASAVHAHTDIELPIGEFWVAVYQSTMSGGIMAFLTVWMVIWVGTVWVRLVAALAIGPLAAFATPSATIPFYYGYYNDYDWGWMIVLWFASVLLGFVVNAIRQVENEEIEHAKNERAEKAVTAVLKGVKAEEIPNFVLYLRAFHGTGLLDTQSGGTVEALDLETILARVIKPQLFVGLGSEMENFVSGAGRVYFGNDEWWDNVRVLATHAAAILVIPSARQGTMDEISWLFNEGMLGKCVFIMPPTAEEEGWQVNVFASSTVLVKDQSSDDQEALWSEARMELRKSVGIELPPYSSAGAFLKIGAKGEVVDARSMNVGSTLFKAKRLRTALVPLVSGTGIELPIRRFSEI